MTIALAKQALVQSYVDGSFGLSTAYPNRNFEPTAGTEWARVTLSLAQPAVATLGSGGEDNYPGFMQIDLSYPTNKGDGPATAKAEAMRAYYYAGRSFSASGTTVRITGSRVDYGGLIDGWFKVYVTVYFYTRLNRS